VNPNIGTAVIAVVNAWAHATPVASNGVWLDEAPDDTTFPYVTVFPGLASPPELLGDGETIAEAELVQVSLWQQRSSEDLDLESSLRRALDKANLKAACPGLAVRVQRCRVTDGQRIPDIERAIIAYHLSLKVTFAPS
jgi:hypothetical protein